MQISFPKRSFAHTHLRCTFQNCVLIYVSKIDDATKAKWYMELHTKWRYFSWKSKVWKVETIQCEQCCSWADHLHSTLSAMSMSYHKLSLLMILRSWLRWVFMRLNVWRLVFPLQSVHSELSNQMILVWLRIIRYYARGVIWCEERSCIEITSIAVYTNYYFYIWFDNVIQMIEIVLILLSISVLLTFCNLWSRCNFFIPTKWFRECNIVYTNLL